uniref:Phosphoinositide-specific phospholipase C EF-hand-like domain-containing protein n=1 Tax=Parascaris equorum TaxID=6256 RepID=A0A914S286_PAREQ
MGQYEHDEEVQQFLRQCRHGFLLKRVKKAHIGSPRRVYIQDDKYFCYHSKGLWKLFPLKLKSVEIDELFEVRTGFSTDNLHYASTKPSFREAASRERLFFDEKRWIAEKFREADDADTKKALSDKRENLLDEEEFVNFFARLTKRPDLDEIIRTFSSSHEEALTVDDLRNFLITEQQFPYVDDIRAQQILQTYETGKQQGQQQKLLGPIGFRQLLQSQWGSIFKPGHETVFQDMRRPL